MWTVVLASGVPIGIGWAVSFTRWVADQMVVSVGPYMLWTLQFGAILRTSSATSDGKVSPPSNRVSMSLRNSRLPESERRILAIEGVHCRIDRDSESPAGTAAELDLRW